MTRILISGLDPAFEAKIAKELEIVDNETTLATLDNTVEIYEDYLPDILLMDFTEKDPSMGILDKVSAFDRTACVFAVAKHQTNELRDELYKRNVRVILNYPEDETPKEFVDQLYSSCSDLGHEKCIGCWNTNRFEDLTKLA